MSLRGCFLLLALLLVAVRPVLAVDSAYEEIKARYLKLRNVDAGISDERAWREAGRDFRDYAVQSPRSRHAPAALLSAAIVSEELFRVRGGRRDLESALATLSEVVTRYGRSEHADDALLRRGDLLRREGAEPEARQAYEQVVREYPRADLAAVAAARLAEVGRLDAGVTGRSDEQPATAGAGPLVVIDPGHGAEDLGAEGPGGILEKDVTLATALALEEYLVGRGGIRVKLTRRGDAFVPLPDRTAVANEAGGAVFISLHVNSSPASTVHGIETYVLDNTGDQASRKLAERENGVAELAGAGGDLAFMLSDLVQTGKLEDSVRLAQAVQLGIMTAVKSRHRDVRNLGVKKAPFHVLVGAHMPCILIEMGFLDHPVEGRRLGNRSYREIVAAGIGQGIENYLRAAGALP